MGLQLMGPAFAENRHLRGRARAGAGDRVRTCAAGAGGAVSGVGAGHRPRDPRPAGHADEDVLRVREPVRRRAEHAHLPALPRPSRRAAGDQRGGGREGAGDRAGAELRDPRAVAVPPQELLLSGQPQGVPDQPVRRADLRARAPRRRGRPGRHRPRPPRGGRREAGARRRRGRADRRRRRLAGRLQPLRHAAGRDRHRARPALARAGGRVPRAAAQHAAHDRRVRLRHGEGLDALRRQRLACGRPGRPSWGRRPSSRT